MPMRTHQSGSVLAGLRLPVEGMRVRVMREDCEVIVRHLCDDADDAARLSAGARAAGDVELADRYASEARAMRSVVRQLVAV